jgi:cyclic nucleotide-binding protein
MGRVMLSPRHRGGMGFEALIGAAYELARLRARCGRAVPDVPLRTDRPLRRTGFRGYAAPRVPTGDGLTVPLVPALPDRSHLSRVACLLLPLAEARYGPGTRTAVDLSRWSASFETGAGPLQLEPTVIWDRVRRRSEAGDPGAQFRRALGAATVRKLIGHGFLMNVEAGQVLTKQGLVQQELFVIIDGQFGVDDETRRLRVVGPGEAVGEIGFFSSDRLARTPADRVQ